MISGLSGLRRHETSAGEGGVAVEVAVSIHLSVEKHGFRYLQRQFHGGPKMENRRTCEIPALLSTNSRTRVGPKCQSTGKQHLV